jgi:tetratricopeptide (TPR) repeat protein
VVSLVSFFSFRSPGARLDTAQQQFDAGDYAACAKSIEAELKDGAGGEERYLLLSRAYMASGRYPDALKEITKGLSEEPQSVRLRWQARDVFLSNGQTAKAAQMVEDIVRRVAGDPSEFRDAPSLVVFGRAALAKNADPKRVLDQLFETARKADPKSRDVYLASGELALDKHDFALAAKKFGEGLKQLPDDAELNYGMARAYAPGDQALMLASAEAALKVNSNHVGCLSLLVEHHIDAEEYPDAEELLDRIKTINPSNPDAWAYRAVLAHLDNRSADEEQARQTGLKYWTSNPRVDYLIGLKLSQKYRFAEGADHQRQSLKFDPDYLPAKAQLAQDLLRLGEESEGWDLAEEVQKEDGYDVEAYNVSNLHQTMAKFTTLTNQDFLVRMGRHEAALYGSRVLDLLSQARSNLCAKYEFDIRRPTIVEIFPEQKDFAVRTFGMPGNPGYLGVCFGQVVTANSPAAQRSHPVNWQAVLWHEFCHCVTLQKTRNKMPRWLSEGISVYEESQANPAWGQHMTPTYREMTLGDELTPISKLSGAFLAPESEEHLQFAYYESSLVVEFLIQHYGLENLKAILRDLGEGDEINAAIAKHSAPMDKLEDEFAAFARDRAEKLAPGLDFEKPEFEKTKAALRQRGRRGAAAEPPAVAAAEDWDTWAKEHPTNFWVMTRQAGQLLEDKQWGELKNLSQRLIDLFPGFVGPDGGYAMLAAAHRFLGETNAEREVLAHWAEKDDEATDAYLRLMEMESAAQNWPAVLLNGKRFLAVNPLIAPPYRFVARAAEQNGDAHAAIAAYQAWLELDPADPAEVHFQLGKLLYRAGDPAAKRHILQALEDAPRSREALKLLLEIEGSAPQTSVAGREKAFVVK